MDTWDLDQHTIDKYNQIDERLEREAQEENARDMQRRAVIAAERYAAALERIVDELSACRDLLILLLGERGFKYTASAGGEASARETKT